MVSQENGGAAISRTLRFVPETPLDPARLTEGAAAVGVTLAPRQAAALAEFGELLLRWNHAFNLISRRDVARLVPRHLLDSLSVAPLLEGGEAMDLGTGAGLPGVPLAIAREDVRFTLVDRSGRKIRFVDRAVRSLNLSNVSTWCGDVRELPAIGFDTVVCRAVADLDACWDLAAARLRQGGRLLVMHRGQGDGDEPGDTAPASAVAQRCRVRIPGLERAHEIVVLRRDDNTRSGP